jgi:hypothetical protein
MTEKDPRIVWSAPKGTTQLADTPDGRYVGRFEFPSSSGKDRYVVAWDSAIGAYTCSCPGGRNRGECKHLKRYRPDGPWRSQTFERETSEQRATNARLAAQNAAWALAVSTGVLTAEEGEEMASLMWSEQKGELLARGVRRIAVLREKILKGAKLRKSSETQIYITGAGTVAGITDWPPKPGDPRPAVMTRVYAGTRFDFGAPVLPAKPSALKTPVPAAKVPIRRPVVRRIRDDHEV